MRRGSRIALAVLALLVLAGIGGRIYLQQRARAEVDAALKDLRPGLDVTYAGLELDLWERSLTLSGVRAATPDGQEFLADAATFSDADTAHATPHFLRCSLRGVRAGAGDWGGPAGSLLRAGTDADLDYVYDPQERVLTVRRLALAQKDAFEAELAGALGNVDLERFLDGYYFASSLARLELVYRDRSLARRVLEVLAAQFRTDPARIRESLSGWAREQAAGARTRGGDRTADSLEALGRFLADPGELRVSLAPAEPVPVLYLFAEGNLAQALELLNARIESR